MDSAKVFVDNVDTFLSRIPAIIAEQAMSPGAPDVSHSVFWDVVSAILEDAIVITKKNNIANLDMIITLQDTEPSLLLTKDAQHIWKSMKTRYQQPSLVRWLALVNRLFSWKYPNEANPDKWVQECAIC
ncbi:hypothetical protein V1524DRAFT_450508 [Lipomyces starkeyi]